MQFFQAPRSYKISRNPGGSKEQESGQADGVAVSWTLREVLRPRTWKQTVLGWSREWWCGTRKNRIFLRPHLYSRYFKSKQSMVKKVWELQNSKFLFWKFMIPITLLKVFSPKIANKTKSVQQANKQDYLHRRHLKKNQSFQLHENLKWQPANFFKKNYDYLAILKQYM